MSNSNVIKPYSINKLGIAVKVDFSKSTAPVPAHSKASPIDEFLNCRADVIVRSATADDQQLGMLLLWLVSASELYFRRIFSELGSLCPIAQEKLATQTVVVGALDYYGQRDVGRAVMDVGPLSDPDSIRKRSLNLLGIEINRQKSQAVDTALDQFDAICQLRHALIHSFGRLGYGNLRILGIKANGPCRIELDVPAFQTSLRIVENLVRSYNHHAFTVIVDRWVAERLLKGLWSDNDKAAFEPLYQVCRCDRDGMPKSGFKLWRAEICESAKKRAARS